MTAEPRLTGFAVSHWGDDPWALGSWSLIGRDGTPQDRVNLGTPVGDRLMIAGEATHPTRAGMTHGAYEQGVAAAVWAADLGHLRVAVVGAGMAGLAAARTLAARGVEVQIWEARDRIGGRTAGVEVAGAALDLGANWLQQYDDNVLARLAESLGLRTVPTDFNDPLILGDRSPIPEAGPVSEADPVPTTHLPPTAAHPSPTGRSNQADNPAPAAALNDGGGPLVPPGRLPDPGPPATDGPQVPAAQLAPGNHVTPDGRPVPDDHPTPTAQLTTVERPTPDNHPTPTTQLTPAGRFAPGGQPTPGKHQTPTAQLTADGRPVPDEYFALTARPAPADRLTPGGHLAPGESAPDGLLAPEAIEIELRARLDAAPVGVGIAEVLEDWLREPGPWDPDAVRRFVDAEIVMDSGAPLSWLSARYGFEPGVGEGDRWIVGGYRLLVDHLAEGLDVRLGHPVREIHVSADGVTLTGGHAPPHGDDPPRGHAPLCGHDSLHVDAVIVTAPLGVLAAGGIVFEPPLPAAHRDAVSRLGMGRVEKVILRFDRRFWPEHPAGYFRVHGPRENCVSEWLDATAADGHPTLVGLFAGPWLDELWAGPDSATAERAAAVINDAAAT